jgi:putative transposase
MAKPPRDQTVSNSRTHFITTRTWEGRALFQTERLANLLLETLFHYRSQGKYGLHEFVVMPNHLHLILSPADQVTLERTMQFIKGGFSHRVGQEYGRVEIWQRGYVDHRIRDAADYIRHREYIWSNPVRAHLVEHPQDYHYSSAHSGFDLDPVPQWLKPREEDSP